MSFADLKKKKSNLDSLTKELEKQSKKTDYTDERFWKPGIDKSGNGYAVIRFLPPAKNEEMTWARYFSHQFKGLGGWYWENCPTTIGGKCPACEANGDLWATELDANKKIASSRKRKLKFVSNIYVITDPANPENEGKVFLYTYGVKIFDKIKEKLQPESYGENGEFADDPSNPFDMWEGLDFKLKIRKVEGYVNYDKSEFQKVSPLLATDKEREAVWKQQHELAPFVADDQFKAYNELKERFLKALSTSRVVGTVEDQKPAPVDNKPVVTDEPKEEETPVSVGDIAKDDNVQKSMDYFEKIADQTE